MGAIGIVVVVVAVIIAVSLTGGNKAKTTNTGSGAIASGAFAVPSTLVSRVEAVPVDALVTQAKTLPADSSPPQALPASNPPFSQGGKPAILYVGAEYCPYCAAERWPLVMALSKFGTFSNLRGTTSSATDANPSTPTFSFYGSGYTSKYLSFLTDEEATNTGTALQNPTSLEQSLVTKYDTTPYVPAADAGQNPIPFVYLGGKYVLTGNQYDASPIKQMQWSTAATYMTSGANATSKAAEAAAGYLVGDLCTLTHDQPVAVCSQVPSVLKGITTTSRTNQGSSTVTTKPTTTKTTAAKTTATTKKA